VAQSPGTPTTRSIRSRLRRRMATFYLCLIRRGIVLASG